jgi:hypothetical protein
MRSVVLLFGAMIIGCSGADFDTASPVEDASLEDANVDSLVDSDGIVDSGGADSTVSDGAVDSGVDSTSGDTGAHADAKPDVVVMPDVPDVSIGETDGTPCQPYWCGCGTCVPTEITCTRTPPGCPLGCVSSCPAADMPGVCGTAGDRCVRNGIGGEVACYRTADCAPGKCCKTSPPARGVCITSPDPDCAP